MKTRVWDLPLRLCHWLLVTAVIAAVTTGKLGGPWLEWHARAGALIMGLVIFRLLWGLVGSQAARFASFAPTPARLRSYWQGTWRGLGHNPLGACSVFALLAVLVAQVSTGLAANDGSDFRGPLHAWMTQATSNQLSSWHAWTFNVLALLTGLHVGAIAYHGWARRTNLLLPMITGDKPAAGADAAPAQRASAWRAAAAAIFAYAIVAGTFNLPTPIHTSPEAAAAPQAPAADW